MASAGNANWRRSRFIVSSVFHFLKGSEDDEEGSLAVALRFVEPSPLPARGRGVSPRPLRR
jgi:hypothetical protein